MKKLFLTALTGILITASSFASNEKGINHNIQSNFNYDFKNIDKVEWSTSDAFTTATFVLNKKRTNAFYNNDGELIGTSQAITIDQLPAYAKRVFIKKYTDYTVLEAIQFESKDETAYYISAKNDDKAIIFKVANGIVSKFK